MNNYYLCFSSSVGSISRMPEPNLNPPDDGPDPDEREVHIPLSMELNVPKEDFLHWKDIIKSMNFDLKDVPRELYIDKEEVEDAIYDACDYLNLPEEGEMKVSGEIVITYDYFVKHGKYEDDEEEFYENPKIEVSLNKLTA